MKNLKKTFKVFYIFLVLCFILVSITSGKRRDKGYWMDVLISPSDLCTGTESPQAVLEVDTTGDECPGAQIPYTLGGFYITFNHCFNYFEPFTLGDDITIHKVEMGCQWHRKTGTYGVMFWLKDEFKQKYYRTEILELSFVPNPDYFSISVNQCLRVYPQTGGGKKKPVGYLSVGTIQYLPK
jgi:hypothetical protein